MASNKNITIDSKNTNVQVKIEPGTSAESSVSSVSVSSVSLSERVRNIKMEPGVPITTQRLTSFRLPRDLTLGGNIKTEKPKKVYTPNLNVQRNKKKDDVSAAVKVEHVRSRDIDRGRTRGRGRGKTDRSNIIQSIGIWSEGIYKAPTTSRRSESFRDSTDSGKYLEKSKINLNRVIDKAEEEKKLKNLLKDDFTDDVDSLDEKMNPFLLPRFQKMHNENVHSDEEIDKKPIISVNGQVIKNEITSQHTEDKKEALKISQILENKANSYILIQFPDRLPGLELCKEESGLKRPSDSNTDNESDIKAKTEHCTLNNLKSGFLGKLEILKSGRTRLRFGEKSFFVDAGIQQQFHQELLVAKIDTVSLTGDLINLGSVNNKLICSPDLESMLDKS